MNLSLFIARRYFFSKKKRNFINVISVISMLAVAIGTAALVVVLSVFNGLEDLIRSLYNTFDPEIKVQPISGKSFEISDEKIASLEDLKGVSVVTQVIEDNALARYKEAELVVRVKGVSENFIEQKRLDAAMVAGELRLKKNKVDFAIIGRGVQYALSLSMQDDFYTLQLFSPKNIRPGNLNPSKLFTQKNILPGGVFAVEKQYDENYVFVPLSFAQDLFSYGSRRTALEIKLDDHVSLTELKNSISSVLGQGFLILDSDQQHSELYRVLKIEKLVVFIAFAFILSIASFNIFFSLSMLAIEKKPDIVVLNAMGASEQLIRKIFLSEGAIIALGGALLGLLLGFTICSVQQSFGLISMGMSTSILDAYPIRMQWTDFMATSVLIIIITLVAAYRPASLAARSLKLRHLQ